MAVPVAAESLFMIGTMPVTNALVNGGLAAVVFAGVAAVLAKRATGAPRGLQNAVEALIEFMLGFMDQVTHDRRRSKRFLPIVGTLFLFILVSNWMGLLPGVGSIGIWRKIHGEIELVPLFRPATSDLNLTLAMGIFSVVLPHVFGIMAIGFFKYWNKFIQIGTLWSAIAAFGKVGIGQAAMGLFTAMIEFVVGLIELVSEAAKMVSLSLRLFGNIFAGEVLLHVLSSLAAVLMPAPFVLMEVIVGLVQALVFSMLTLVYLTLATDPVASHGEGKPREAAAH